MRYPSNSEEEYVALEHAVKESLFLRQISRLMLPGKGMLYFPVLRDN